MTKNESVSITGKPDKTKFNQFSQDSVDYYISPIASSSMIFLKIRGDTIHKMNNVQ